MRGTGAPHRNSIGAPLEKGFVDDGWVAARPTAFRCTEAADVDRIRYGIEDLTSSPEPPASGPPAAKKRGLLDHRRLDAIGHKFEHRLDDSGFAWDGYKLLRFRVG